MRICILTDEEIQDFDPAPYMNGFDWEMVTMTDPVLEVLRELDARNEFDVYLNLCEGNEPGEDADWEYQGIDVVRALEELNLPFTGADSRFFDPSREEMQAAADAHGVGFAKGYQVRSVKEAQKLEFRAEAFNVTNSFHMKNPTTNFNSNIFGQVTSAKDPRIMQFALKYFF